MSDSNWKPQTVETTQELPQESWVRVWLLIGANRWLIVGGLAVGVFAALVLAGLFGPASVSTLLDTQDPVDTVFQGLVSAVITGVTLVLTINQLILSQELGPVEEQRDRIEGALQFRRDVEDATALAVAPARPSVLLRALLEATRRQAVALGEDVGADADEEVRDEIREYADGIAEDAKTVRDELEGLRFDTSGFLHTVLQFDYSQKIHDGRRFRNVYGARGRLSSETDDALDDLVETLAFFASLREHTRNLHFQWELVNLSRMLIYTSIPALLVAYVAIVYFDPAEVTGVTLGVSNKLWAVSGALTVTTLPFLTFVAYILRIGTVAKRTLAVGPLILQTTGHEEDIEWDDDER